MRVTNVIPLEVHRLPGFPVNSVQTQKANTGFRVTVCREGSNALKSGVVEAGQQILRVNGSALDRMDKKEVMQLIKASNQGLCTVRVFGRNLHSRVLLVPTHFSFYLGCHSLTG
jgi:hypothetical protein